jgi:hypothetical protein
MADTLHPPSRGVYTLTFYDATGDRLAVAIDSHGRCVSWLPFRDDSADRVEDMLRSLLDAADPPPSLRVLP